MTVGGGQGRGQGQHRLSSLPTTTLSVASTHSEGRLADVGIDNHQINSDGLMKRWGDQDQNCTLECSIWGSCNVADLKITKPITFDDNCPQEMLNDRDARLLVPESDWTIIKERNDERANLQVPMIVPLFDPILVGTEEPNIINPQYLFCTRSCLARLTSFRHRHLCLAKDPKWRHSCTGTKHNTTNTQGPAGTLRQLNKTVSSKLCLHVTEPRGVSRPEAGGVAMLVVVLVLSTIMVGSCDAFPTPLPTFPASTDAHNFNFAPEPPSRELRLCCEVGGRSPVAGGVKLRPANVTVVRRSATSVLVTWTRPVVQPLKYEITYKPTNAKYRVVAEVTAPQRSVVLERLLPLTQYQVFVTSVINSTALQTSPTVTFHTATHSSPANDTGWVISTPTVLEGGDYDRAVGVDPTGLVRVRAEEVAIVLLVLAVWMFAIALFFNRWGKIRMLEPYQEPYKESPPSNLLQHRPSCPMAVDPSLGLPVNPLKRLSLTYTQMEQLGGRRLRQNSVFVGRTRSHSLDVHPPRRVKSALNLTTLVLQESEEEGAIATTMFT